MVTYTALDYREIRITVRVSEQHTHTHDKGRLKGDSDDAI